MRILNLGCAACLAMLLLPIHDLCADTIICKDGRKFEGEILKETENTVRVRTVRGTVTLPRADIKTIERGESIFEKVRKQKAALAEDDAKGRWELAEFCAKGGLRLEAVAFLQELRMMASPFYVKATLKLADLVADSNARGAIQLLDDLFEKTKDSQAKARSTKIKEQLDAKRRKAYEEALTASRAKRWPQAFDGLEYAYKLSYPGLAEQGKGKITEDMVLKTIIDLRRSLEQSARGRAAQASAGAGGDLSCTACKASGWGTCHTCKGQGTVTKVTPPTFSPRGVIPGKRYKVKCGTCRGAKMARCKTCSGSGLSMTKITGRPAWAVRSVANDAWTLRNRDPFQSLQRMERKVGDGRLVLPEGFKPSYSLSKLLREMLPEVPIGARFSGMPAYARFKTAWDAAAKQVRANFLCNYAYEASQNSLPTVGHAGGDYAPVLSAEGLDLKRIRARSPTADATEVSAFPASWGGKWIFVEGVFKGVDDSLSGRDRIAFDIDSKLPNNLHSHVYLPLAERYHKLGATEPRAPPFLKMIALNYPYENVSKTAKGLKAGERVRLLGRVLYREDRNPETSLEVWDIEVFVDEETQKNLALIRKPVTFRFQDTPLSESLYFLSLVTGTKIRLDAKDAEGLTVNGRATGQPLAQALSTLLKDVKLEWVFDDKGSGLKVVQGAKAEEKEARDKVVSHLKR